MAKQKNKKPEEITEQEFLNIVKHLDLSPLSMSNRMFCEFYMKCVQDIRLRLFNDFPELVEHILIEHKIQGEKQ